MASKRGPNRELGGVFPYNPMKRRWCRESTGAHSGNQNEKVRGLALNTKNKFEKPHIAAGDRYYARLNELGMVTKRNADGSYYLTGDLTTLTAEQREYVGVAPTRSTQG